LSDDKDIKIGMAVPDGWGKDEKRNALSAVEEFRQSKIFFVSVPEAAIKAFLRGNPGFGGQILIVDFGAREVRLSHCQAENSSLEVLGRAKGGMGALDFEQDLANRLGASKASFRTAWAKAIEEPKFQEHLMLHAINPLIEEDAQAFFIGKAPVRCSDIEKSYDATVGESLLTAFSGMDFSSGDMKALMIGGMHDFPFAVKQLRTLLKSGLGLDDLRFVAIGNQRAAAAYGAAIAASEWDGKAAEPNPEKAHKVAAGKESARAEEPKQEKAPEEPARPETAGAEEQANAEEKAQTPPSGRGNGLAQNKDRDKRALTGKGVPIIKRDSVVSIVVYRPYVADDGQLDIREEIVRPKYGSQTARASFPVAVDGSVELDIQGARRTEKVSVTGEYVISATKEKESARVSFSKSGQVAFEMVIE
jgi:hypothetical protein